jgi:hypothetical protein
MQINDNIIGITTKTKQVATVWPFVCGLRARSAGVAAVIGHV